MREVALDLIDPERQPTDDEAELLLGDWAMAMRVMQETKRPLTLIGHREFTMWRAWFIVEGAISRIQMMQVTRKQRRR